VGTALLIVAEIVAWGAAVLLIGGAIETAFSWIRRRSKQTLR
jgi:hypothetical protein